MERKLIWIWFGFAVFGILLFLAFILISGIYDELNRIWAVVL